MKIAGIIAEYNPFHNGHKYHIEETRRITGADAVVAIMSGNFVQRGDCAISDKWTRAHAALLGGADLVIELPVYYSLAVAQLFAFGAVSTLDSLGCVDFLSFGMETDDISPLYALAEKLAFDNEKIEGEIKKHLGRHTGYPAARQKALAILYRADETLLSSPNNMLALEYMRALFLQSSKIQPIGVKRKDSSYHDDKVTSACASATAVRAAILQDVSISSAVPQNTMRLYEQARQNNIFPVCAADFEQIMLSFLRLSSAESLKNIIDMPNGMENRLISAANKAVSIDELIDLCCARQFTRSRIRRLLFASFLGINDMGYTKSPSYIRILGLNKTGRKVLNKIQTGCRLPIITKTSNYDKKDSDPLFMLDCRSTDLYCMAYKNSSRRKGGADFTTPPIIL